MGRSDEARERKEMEMELERSGDVVVKNPGHLGPQQQHKENGKTLRESEREGKKAEDQDNERKKNNEFDLRNEVERVNPDYLLVDTPGQIELFAYRTSG